MPKSLTDLQVFNNIEANNTVTAQQMITDDIHLNDNNISLASLHNDLQHNGVAETEKSKWALSYNATTRVFTVTLSAGSYYYVNGKRFDLSAGAHNWPAHTNTNGLYFFYLNSTGVKTTSSTVWDVLNTAQVAVVKYNATNDGGGPAGLLMYELHGMVMSPAMHKYEHLTEGTRLIQGGGISGFTIGTSSVAAITWSTTDSEIADEDIHTIVLAQPESNYLLGYFDAGLNFNWRTSATIPILTNGTDIQYNQIGVGLTPVTGNNVYVNYYVLLLPAVSPTQRTLIIPGQAIYNTLVEAQQESPANLNLGDLPFQEYVFLYQITFVRSAGGDIATGKSAIAATPVRQGASRSTLASSASDHNLLSNRNVPGAHLAGSIATNDGAFTGILQPALDIDVQTALENLSIHALDRNMFNAAGDLIYASADNTPEILPVGTNGEVLKLVSGIPSWEPDNNTTYSVGNGLTSSGTIFSMGTPSGLSAATTNATTTTSHTHAISTASAVALSNTSTSTTGTSASLARADHTHAISGFSLSTHNHTGTYQPLDADLTSIAGLSGTSGFLKKTAANTWSLDTNSYLNLTGGTLTGTLTSRAITPSTNNTYNIGTSSVKYKNGYFAGTLTADGGATIGGTLSVNNLTVNGTTTTINSTTLTIDDPILTLGGDTAPTLDDNKDRGIEYRWHNGTTAKLGFFGYDDSTGYFTFIPDATNTNEVFSGAKGTLDANLNGNASTVTNGVYTTGSYSDPSWLSISKAKVGLSNVENTKLSTWAGTTNITTVGAITATSVNGLTIDSTTGTLDIANGKTFTANNTLTLSGTDGSTLNIGTGGTLGTGAFAAAYVHPSDGGGSIPTALTGANVVSAITVNSLGHVTGTSTRALTPGNIGAATSGHNHTLDGLSNTTITSNSSGEILKWNGSAWVNNTLAEAGIATSTHTHGNITNAGAIGSTSNQVVVTGTSGVLTTASRSGIDSRTTFPPSSHTHLYAGSATAGGPADSTKASLTLKFDSGTTEGTSQYTFNGSTAKTINIKGGSNVTITEAAGAITIASSYVNTNYYPTSFAWTGGTSAGPTGSLTGTGMSAVSFGAIPTASATASGIVTNSVQTFAGNKTFNGTLISSNATTALRVNLSNSDTNIIRVNGSSKSDDTGGDYGFSLRYLGTLGGVENALALIADNQTGTEIESFRIKQDGTFNTNNQIISTLTTGTSPFAVASTTVVTNLNADTVDGKHASAFATAGHTHSAYDRASSVLSGSSVFSDITVVDGIVTGTATRSITKADISLGNVENTKLSTWAGTSNITTVGTLSSGTIPWSLISGEPSTYAPSAHTLNSHSNVTISSIASGEILKWNGTAWVNNTLSEAGIQPADADLTSIAGLTGTTGLLKKTAANTWTLDTTGYTTNTGTVTSVAMTVPTGLSVSGTPITTSGTLAVKLATGYSIPTTTKQGQWDTAYTNTHTSGSDNQTITSGNGMNFTSGSGNVTITLGKPSTLSASTNDATTSTSHTHAITATDSGSASTIVKTGSDGSVTAANTFKFGTNASMVYNSTSKTIDFVFA